MLPNILILFVLLSAILALAFFRRNLLPVSFKYLLVYLTGNFIFELVVLFLTIKDLNNIGVYNLEMLFEVSFFMLFFRKISAKRYFRYSINVLLPLFLFCFIINILFFQPIGVFSSNTYTLGSLFLFYVCGFFLFISILQDESKNPLRSINFWISLGVLFCYLGNFPFLSNVNQLFSINESMALTLRTISISVNVLLYLLIIVGIVCSRQT